MPTHFFIASAVLGTFWLAWMVYWAISARSAKPTAYTQPLRQRILFRLLMVAAIVCMQDLPVLHDRFLPPFVALEIAGIALCAVGLLFAVWARVYLAGNWSAWVTIKQGHELISTGPYALVRHPIYTGVIAAILGTVLALAPSIGGSITMVLMIAAFVIKMLAEEAVMRKEFPEAYPAYKARVPAALIPFLL